MKILAIGDPHGNLDKIKKISLRNVDLILLTGDLGDASLMRKMAFENVARKKQGLQEKEYSSKEKKRAFMESYNSAIKIVRYLARFAPVYTVFGNVENSNPETRENSRDIGLPLPFLTNDLNLIEGVRIINNRIANYRGIKIGGLNYFVDTSWIREFKPSDFREKMANAKKETDKARRVLNQFGELEILICHQPPYGVLDKVTAKFAPKHWLGKHAGSKVILDYIKKYQPSYVFCGHIHEGKGMRKVGKTEVYNLGVVGYKIIDIN